MKKLLTALMVCGAAGILVQPANADPQSVSARLASVSYPVPTFAELHERFAALCVNESGFISIPDQDGILRAMLSSGGGGRRAGRNKRGQGYGLDYSRLMRRMARHSTRTFPADSKFLLLSDARRARLAKRQTRLNRWTSTLKLDCTEPAGWPKTKTDGSPMQQWRDYEDRCAVMVESTRAVLKGEVKSRCDGEPTTWGNEKDVEREGGPLDQGWTQIYCDRPPDTPESCAEKTRLEIWRDKTCARNTFWTWIPNDKEERDGNEKEAAHQRAKRGRERQALARR